MNQNSIYTLLQVNKNASISAFKLLRRVKGLNCIIRPTVKVDNQAVGSIFGLEDLVEYDEKDAYPEKVLLFNIFQEASQGMNDYDTFIEAHALTLLEEKFELQTLIEVDFYGRKMTFKVDDHKNVTPTIGEQLFIKNILVPAT